MSMAPKDFDILGIGQPSDENGSETNGSVNAKLNALLGKVNAGVGTVKSIQYGVAQGFSIRDEIAISEVEVEKSIIWIQGGVQSSSFFPMFVQEVKATSFKVGSYNFGSTPFYFSWYVIEFY